MTPDPDALVDSNTLVVWLSAHSEWPVLHSTLRTWATRGRLPIRGKTLGGRNLYRLSDAARLVRLRDTRKRAIRDLVPADV